jgi:hypothetical protein
MAIDAFGIPLLIGIAIVAGAWVVRGFQRRG